MAVSRTGDWARARRLLTAAPQRLQAAIGTAVRQEAHALRNEIVQGLTRQAPGELSQVRYFLALCETLNFTRAAEKCNVTQPSLTRAIHALEHEFGGPPVIIPMTPKMRRFLFALLRQAGKEPTGGSGRGVIVVQVPARPFLRPAFDKFREGASRRFLERVATELGLAP